jgi:hypothetical protein
MVPTPGGVIAPATLPASAGVPRVVISSPVAGQQFESGQEVKVQSESVALEGITRLELLVNDRVVETNEFLPQPNAAFVTKQTWVADLPGRYVLQVRAFTPGNIVGQSAPVVVEIAAGVAAVIPDTPTPVPTPSPAQPADRPTNTPETIFIPFTPTSTPPSGTATPTYPYLQVNADLSLNVRAGPGTQYGRVGVLLADETAEIVGQNNINGPWWQIRFAPAPDGLGWVSASVNYAQAFNTDSVAIVAAPPLPVAAVSTETPTATPAVTGLDFTVDRTNINSGECVTFRWNVSNVKEVYFRGGGVPGDNQSQTECPTYTQEYDLRVVYENDTTDTRVIKIEVAGGGYSRLEMEEGESVDFDDNGKVTDDDGDDFKLLEDDDDLIFKTWNEDDDLRQVPVGPVETLDIIRKQDCEWALANLNSPRTIEPFGGFAVCFRTDDGRLGKLRFDEVDDDDVEIEWALW